MRRPLVTALTVLAVALVACADPHPRPAVHTPPVHAVADGDAPVAPEVLAGIAAHDAAQLAAWLGAVEAQREADAAAYLASLAPPAPPPDPAPAARGPQPATGGTRSYAWWEALATCESGNTNAWRTGYYGLEAGEPVGGLSKDAQLAWAERIYAQYGDSAWGCAPVAWAQVPGG